jgi:hypothetical protein
LESANTPKNTLVVLALPAHNQQIALPLNT